MHQDAHEFLNYLLNRIVEEIEEERKSAPESDREWKPTPLRALNTIVLWLNTFLSFQFPGIAVRFHRL